MNKKTQEKLIIAFSNVNVKRVQKVDYLEQVHVQQIDKNNLNYYQYILIKMKRSNKARNKGKTLSSRTVPRDVIDRINQNSQNSQVQRVQVSDKAKVEQLITRLKKDLNGPMGMKFIKTVFYPELYKARIPYSLNNSTTAVVTHIEEADVNTGADGQGVMFFFPKVTNGYCIQQYLPDSSNGIGGLYVYQWATGTSAGTYTATGATTQVNIAAGSTVISWRPIISMTDMAAALWASSNDPKITSVTVTTMPTILTKAAFSHAIDNAQAHPMVFDFVNSSSITPATVPSSSYQIYPYDAASTNSLNTILNASPMNQQTSLNHNFDVIYWDLLTILSQYSGGKGISSQPVYYAPTIFPGSVALPTGQWPMLAAATAYNTVTPATNSATGTTYNFQATNIGLLGGTLINTPTVVSQTISAQSSGLSGWQGLGYQNYAVNYDKAALVGASISIEYVGRFDYESGYIAASHIEDLPIDQVTTTDIDQGQFSVKAKPNEGLRMVWQPTVQNDFELFFTSQSDSTTLGARIPAQSMYGNEKMLQKPSTDTTLPNVVKYQTSAPCIAIYWKGMTPKQNGFRLTITRRFNMIPNKASKPIADLNRPDINIDPLLTMQKVFQLTRLAPFGGSTLADAALYNGVRQNFINTIEFNPNLKFGSLRELNAALTGELQGDPASNDQG